MADGPLEEPMLELSGITGGYGSTTVLRDVSLSVPRGSVVALLGPMEPARARPCAWLQGCSARSKAG